LDFQFFCAENIRVNCKKLLALLVGLCVLLAPVLSNAAVVVPIPAAQTHDYQVDCHAMPSVNGQMSHDDANTPNNKTAHGCCVNVVGILSATNLVQPYQSSNELIPFNPSLRLISRVEGLYRPPRQNS
jgi:hypothetical protein